MMVRGCKSRSFKIVVYFYKKLLTRRMRLCQFGSNHYYVVKTNSKLGEGPMSCNMPE